MGDRRRSENDFAMLRAPQIYARRRRHPTERRSQPLQTRFNMMTIRDEDDDGDDGGEGGSGDDGDDGDDGAGDAPRRAAS